MRFFVLILCLLASFCFANDYGYIGERIALGQEYELQELESSKDAKTYLLIIKNGVLKNFRGFVVYKKNGKTELQEITSTSFSLPLMAKNITIFQNTRLSWSLTHRVIEKSAWYYFGKDQYTQFTLSANFSKLDIKAKIFFISGDHEEEKEISLKKNSITIERLYKKDIEYIVYVVKIQ